MVVDPFFMAACKQWINWIIICIGSMALKISIFCRLVTILWPSALKNGFFEPASSQLAGIPVSPRINCNFCARSPAFETPKCEMLYPIVTSNFPKLSRGKSALQNKEFIISRLQGNRFIADAHDFCRFWLESIQTMRQQERIIASSVSP